MIFQGQPLQSTLETDTGKGVQIADAEPPDDKSRNTAAALTVIAPPTATMVVPAMVADLGEAAALRFVDFCELQY